MRNRWNLLVLLAALTSSAVAQSQLVTSAYGQAAKSNIVVIISDDMGYTDTSPYGSEILTPNLQRMADNGLRFSDFYATPRCSPSRAALLTGQYSHAVGVGHLSDGPTANGGPGYVNDLNRTNNQTMAEMLRGAGYATQVIGKWHVTPKYGVNTSEANKYNWPLQRGFDQFYGTIRGGVVHDPSHLIDIMATLQDITDASYPAAGGAVRPLDGVSLASTFTGGSVQRDAPLFWEHEGWRAARKGDWKLMASGPSGIWELYDMSSDRAELHNVAAAHPQVVSNLASQWEGWAAANQVTPWPWNPQYQNLLPNQKPVIHLKLDEPSVLNGSQLADAQGATYTFAANDAADPAVSTGVPAGLGGAVRFNNSNNNSDVIRINSTLVPYGRQARSLAAWVNVASVNATDDNRLFAYQTSDATNGSWFAITLDDTDNDNQDIEAIRFRYTGSHTYTPVGGPIAMNAWFHIAVVMPEDATAGLVEVYINGVKAGLVSTATSGVLLDTLAGDLGIGGRPDSQFNLGFDGMIADFQLYNRALSGDQVLELFSNPGKALPEPTAAVLGGAAGTMLLRRSRK